MKLSLILHNNNKKKKHFESTKLPFDAGIENFSFKSISVFLLCFLREKIHNCS